MSEINQAAMVFYKKRLFESVRDLIESNAILTEAIDSRIEQAIVASGLAAREAFMQYITVNPLPSEKVGC